MAGRTPLHASGEVQDHAVVQPPAGYNYDDTRGDVGPGSEETVLRWGDYNGAAVDPGDGSSWVISQSPEDPTPTEAGSDVTELYGTRIAKVEIQC